MFLYFLYQKSKLLIHNSVPSEIQSELRKIKKDDLTLHFLNLKLKENKEENEIRFIVLLCLHFYPDVGSPLLTYALDL